MAFSTRITIRKVPLEGGPPFPDAGPEDFRMEPAWWPAAVSDLPGFQEVRLNIVYMDWQGVLSAAEALRLDEEFWSKSIYADSPEVFPRTFEDRKRLVDALRALPSDHPVEVWVFEWESGLE